MTPLALEMLRDIDKDTVPFQLNFDDTLKEPDMLPARFPKPAGQRGERHRRGPGDQHPAAQPARDHRGHGRRRSTTRTFRWTN